jgi:hypothetical protein
METKIKIDISIEGTPITHFSSFNLDQCFNEHHTFQLRFNHNQIENTNKITLERSKDFIGKNLTVQFGRGEHYEHQFIGKITRVEIAQSHGFQGDIVVSGFSPSILIDRGPGLGSYLNKDLKTIVEKATADAPQNTFKGVSADSEKLSVRHAQKPSPDMQLANVIDNDDPQKQGRIKVQLERTTLAEARGKGVTSLKNALPSLLEWGIDAYNILSNKLLEMPIEDYNESLKEEAKAKRGVTVIETNI